MKTFRAARWWLVVGLAVGVAGAPGLPGRADDVLRAEPGRVTVAELPLGAVRPAGWLKGQLEIQAKGLSGHLDEFWPDIRDSSWIGGRAEGWERTPYWMDGIVPLAYLLDDAGLKAKVQRYIDYILAHQQADGWLGPIGDTGGHKPYDVWPLFVLFKALTQYQEATGDPRIVPALLRCSKKIDEVVTREPLYEWAKFRGADLVVSLHWLYERTGDRSLMALAAKINQQSYDWRHHFENFARYQPKATFIGLDNHGVNTGMGLKFGAVRSLTTKDPADLASLDHMLAQLDRYHGQATGAFSCDEHLAGPSPSQGTELCTVAEEMYSLEVALGIRPTVAAADRLEKLAFNALPATFKKDMTAHQYDQQANQVVCKIADPRVYTDNGPEANLYGLEPNFGCCTANMHQGWPKFATHLWGRSTVDGGLVALAYAPSVVQTKVNGTSVRVEVRTEYPFRDELTITIRVDEEAKIPLHLRIPGWLENGTFAFGGDLQLRYNSLPITASRGTVRFSGGPLPEAGSLDFVLEGKGTETLTLKLSMPVRLRDGYNGAVSVERGPLVYALRMDTEFVKLRGREPFADYEVFADSPWNYALVVDRAHPERSITFEDRPLGPMPFSPEGSPVVARALGVRLADWTLKDNAAAPPPMVDPAKLRDLPAEPIALIPYGATDLRVTEFPALPPR